MYTDLQSTSSLVDCLINHRLLTFSQLNACHRCLLLIINKVVLLTLLYVFDRMTDKLADVNNQSSAGMFSFYDVSAFTVQFVLVYTFLLIIYSVDSRHYTLHTCSQVCKVFETL